MVFRTDRFTTALIVDACRSIYESRNQIVAGATIDEAREGLRRAMAIERYVASKEHKDEARRAARVLETAVGEALGEAGPSNQHMVPSLASNGISRDDRHRFRLMAAHRDLWWPVLAEKALSRRQVLTMIAEANRPRAIGPGEARISEMAAEDWLAGIEGADLLLTDPPSHYLWLRL